MKWHFLFHQITQYHWNKNHTGTQSSNIFAKIYEMAKGLLCGLGKKRKKNRMQKSEKKHHEQREDKTCLNCGSIYCAFVRFSS